MRQTAAIPETPETASSSHSVSDRRSLGEACYATRKPLKEFRNLFLGIGAAVAILVVLVLRYGGSLLVDDDPLNVPVEAAVVPQGSVSGEKARVAGAVRVLQEQKATRVLISVPHESYWGEQVPLVARNYIEKKYGFNTASRIEFCETDGVDSTEQEAEVLLRCIDARGWKQVAVVTSNYHTCRTGIIWKRLLRQEHAALNVRVHGVSDPEFIEHGWWRDRRSAKTWLLESTKLLSTLFGR